MSQCHRGTSGGKDNCIALYAMQLTTPSVRTIAVIGLNGVQTLDVSGPMEVFAVASQQALDRARYRVLLGTTDGAAIFTNAGLTLGPALALEDLPDDLDTIIVAGGSEEHMRLAITETNLLGWLRQRSSRTRRIASVCTGALILAAAGLLEGRRATTHWDRCALLQEMAATTLVEPDAIFVADHPIYTSAGVTAGIDLCLALVEADHGSEAALAVARELVLFLRRPGGQSQFSAGLGIQVLSASPLRALVAEIIADPTGDLRSQALAARVNMTERTFSRAFRKEVKTTPAAFVEQARVNRAKAMLEVSDWPLARVAERSGFGTPHALHRAFQRQVGITPGEFRERFGAPRTESLSDKAPKLAPS